MITIVSAMSLINGYVLFFLYQSALGVKIANNIAPKIYPMQMASIIPSSIAETL